MISDGLPHMPETQPTPQQINAVIFGLTEDAIADIVRDLRKRTEVNVVSWFGILSDADQNTFEYYRHKVDYDFHRQVPDELIRQLQAELFYFADNNMRRHVVPNAERRIPARVGSLYDDIDDFHRYLYNAWALYNDNDVNLVVVEGAPHCSADWVMIKVAQYLGIEVLILYPVPLANRYMYFTEFDKNTLDFNVYYDDRRPHLREPEVHQLDPEEPLFYMTSTPEAPTTEDTQLLTKGDWQWIVHTLKWDVCKLLGLKSLLDKTKDPKTTYMLPKHATAYTFKKLWHDVRQDLLKQVVRQEWQAIAEKTRLFTKYLDYKAWRRALYHATDKIPPNLDEKYVYFPLHFQPEMTTQAQCNQIFLNQALVIEKLATMLPDDWKIYVKENPIQYETCRSQAFYNRLKAIPNLHIVPITTNTFQLTQHSQFVATITGTAGWEALKNAKPVLVFGNTWYENLPGAFKYVEGMTLDELLAYQYDQSTLEKAFSDLMARCNEGVACVGYAAMCESFNRVTNTKAVADFIQSHTQTRLLAKAALAASSSSVEAATIA